jgi:tubulin polyglutamylase TTLL9
MSKGSAAKKTEIKFKSLFSNTIHEVLSRRPGWKETDKDDWDFIWADKDWIRLHFDEFRNSFTSTTRVNHFRNHYELTRKDHMVKNLKRMVSNLRREDKAAEAANYDFFPVTYLLPMEYGVFVEDFKRQTDKPIWIAKPTGKAQGKGIFLFTDLKDVKLWKRAAENRGKPQQVGQSAYQAAHALNVLIAAACLIPCNRRMTRMWRTTLCSATSPTPTWSVHESLPPSARRGGAPTARAYERCMPLRATR